MANPEHINVSQLLDETKLSRFVLRVITIAFFIVLVEGYDISAMAFALPGLMKDWRLTDASAFGPVLAASMVGMLIGSPLFGQLGDRYGRRKLIIAACLSFAVFTGLTILATNMVQLSILRFLAGVGLGGAAPNVITLVSEFAPARRRATIVTMMFSGIGLGGALAGLIAAMLLRTFGWASLFYVGTALPIVIVIICVLWLPESPKFLVTRGRHEEAFTVLRAATGTALPNLAATQLVIDEKLLGAGRGIADLFRHGLAQRTMLIWTAVFGVYMTFYVLLNWTPALLTMARVPVERASLAQMIFQIGGVIGGSVIGQLLDRQGLSATRLVLLAAVVPTSMIGLAANWTTFALYVIEFAAGFCILGVGYGFGAVAAMIYPTAIRSNGAGWALGAGRFGSIIGVVGAGSLVAAGVPLDSLFILTAIPLLLAAIACTILARHLRLSALGHASLSLARPEAKTVISSSSI